MSYFRIYSQAQSIYRRFVFPSVHAVPVFPPHSLRFVDRDGDEVIAEDLQALYEACHSSAGQTYSNPISAIYIANDAAQFDADDVPLEKALPAKFALEGTVKDGAPGWSLRHLRTLSDLHPEGAPDCGNEYYYYDAAVDGWCSILSGAELAALVACNPTSAAPMYLVCGNHVINKDPRADRAKEAGIALAARMSKEGSEAIGRTPRTVTRILNMAASDDNDNGNDDGASLLPSVPRSIPGEAWSAETPDADNASAPGLVPIDSADAELDESAATAAAAEDEFAAAGNSPVSDASSKKDAAEAGVSRKERIVSIARGLAAATAADSALIKAAERRARTPTPSKNGESVAIPHDFMRKTVGFPLPGWASNVVPVVNNEACGSDTHRIRWTVSNASEFAVGACDEGLKHMQPSSTVDDFAKAASLFSMAAVVAPPPTPSRKVRGGVISGTAALTDVFVSAPYNAACAYSRLHAAAIARTAHSSAIVAAVAKYPILWPAVDSRSAHVLEASDEVSEAALAAAEAKVAEDPSRSEMAILPSDAGDKYTRSEDSTAATFFAVAEDDADRAIACLAAAAARGFVGSEAVDIATSDPDFGAIMEHPSFVSLLDMMQGECGGDNVLGAALGESIRDSIAQANESACDAPPTETTSATSSPRSRPSPRAGAKPLSAFQRLEKEILALGVATAHLTEEQLSTRASRVQSAWDAYRSEAPSNSAAAAAAAGDAARTASTAASGAARAAVAATQGVVSEVAKQAVAGTAAAKAKATDVAAAFHRKETETGSKSTAAAQTMSDVAASVGGVMNQEAKKVDASIRGDVEQIRKASLEAAAVAHRMAASVHATIQSLLGDMTNASRGALEASDAAVDVDGDDRDDASARPETPAPAEGEGGHGVGAMHLPGLGGLNTVNAQEAVHSAAQAAERASKQAAAAAAVLAGRLADALAEKREQSEAHAAGFADDDHDDEPSTAASAAAESPVAAMPASATATSGATGISEEDVSTTLSGVIGRSSASGSGGAADLPSRDTDGVSQTGSDESDMSLLFE